MAIDWMILRAGWRRHFHSQVTALFLARPKCVGREQGRCCKEEKESVLIKASVQIVIARKILFLSLIYGKEIVLLNSEKRNVSLNESKASKKIKI
jgi:hypothetical protein